MKSIMLIWRVPPSTFFLKSSQAVPAINMAP